ncbi:MAG TPA: BatA and WFA domain-containing protein [Bryobacteraceae bacterium]|nr:BatA and WFA domain-containing protein [Bryobacteraceae bacterium]
MGFLAPWFLIGALAVGLPLWLHLLRQYKRTPQPFSSLMFFERRVQSSVKHRRLRYLALLAMRMSLLLLLALAFANFYINRKSHTAARRTLHVVAIDRSFSMRATNRMAEAKQQAQRVIAALPGTSLGQVLAVDAHVESMTQTAVPKQAMAAAVSSIQPDDRASSFGEFARALRYLAQTSGMRLEVDFFSDMQQSGMPADFRELQAGPFVTLQLHCVGGLQPNWAVENVIAPAEVNSAENRAVATIRGWNTPAATRNASLLLDGRVIAQKTVAVPPNGSASAEFSGFNVPYGWHRGEIRIEPGDALSADDSFGFAIEHADPKKALLLYAARNRVPTLYYRTALETGTAGSISVQAAPIEDASLHDFSRFAFVVLSDVGELDPALSDALCGYVQKGGAVFIALGPNTARSGIIPLSKEQFSEQREKQAAGYVDNSHPALTNAGRFENVQFSETASFAPKPDARVLAKYADGSPLLIEERSGEGRKLIFASTLDNSTNDFVLHPAFVPFVAQTARYLAGMDEKASSVVVGTPVTLRHRSNTGAADVIGPDGRHELSLSEASRALSYNVERSGFYEVSRADGQHVLLAANPDRRESDLRSVSSETLDLWRNTGDTSVHRESANVQTVEQPWSLWRWFLGAALLAALIESAFASRYLKEERQTA